MMPHDGARYEDGPPWVFKGRALYQLQLVKADVARQFIPPDFTIVEAFGYTLGGLYFAEYDSSPAGKMNELVAIAGIVWNPPSSCGWAGRVLVDQLEARDHGRTEVGLPSHLGSFVKKAEPLPAARIQGGWTVPFSKRQGSQEAGKQCCASRKGPSLMHVEEEDALGQWHKLCSFTMPAARPKRQWSGPRIRMSLPSFSGKTPAVPELLKYACNLQCNVSLVSPAGVKVYTQETEAAGSQRGALKAVLMGRPVCSILFENMEMLVNKPLPVQADDPALKKRRKKVEEPGGTAKAPGFARALGFFKWQSA